MIWNQYGKLFALCFVLGLIMPRLTGANLQANVLSYDDLNLENALVEYHLWANETTNKYIARLMTETDPLVSYPISDEACGIDNISTYCLAVQLNAEMIRMEESLVNRRDDIVFEDYVDGPLFNLDAALTQASNRASSIDSEIQAARDALDLNLAVYNQIQTVYPIHHALQAMVKDLDTYNTNLAALRNTIEGYPKHFQNASTIHCK